MRLSKFNLPQQNLVSTKIAMQVLILPQQNLHEQ